MKQQVIVLGASGILGRAVFEELKRHTDELDVLGTANARVTADLHQLNAMDDDEVIAFLDQHLSSSSSSPPPIVINCVAERRPDICDSHPDQTRRLNVEFVAHLAKEVTKRQAVLIHISTDYVFDGTSPPYKPSDAPHPLNSYGEGKLHSEQAASTASSHVILRVPVLFGPSSELAESPIAVLALPLILGDDKEKQPKKVDNWGARFPTLTSDVAVVLYQMVQRLMASPSDLLGKIFHWSSKERSETGEPYTKYRLTKLIGSVLNLPSDHILSDPEPPKGAPRPKNCELDVSALQALGIGKETPLREGLASVLPGLIDSS